MSAPFLDPTGQPDLAALKQYIATTDVAVMRRDCPAWNADPTDLLCAAAAAWFALHANAHARVLYEYALEYLEQHPEAKAPDTNLASGYAMLGNCAARDGDLDTAIAAWTRGIDTYGDSDPLSLFRLAITLRERGRKSEALERVERLLQLTPSEIGNNPPLQPDELAQARRLRKVLQVEVDGAGVSRPPNSPEGGGGDDSMLDAIIRAVLVHMQAAETAYADDRFSDAVTAFESALALMAGAGEAPGPKTLQLRATCYGNAALAEYHSSEASGKYPDVSKILTYACDAVRCRPDYPGRENLADVVQQLLYMQIHVDPTLKVVDGPPLAAESRPALRKWLKQGWDMLLKQRDWEAAGEAFEHALTLAPDFAPAYVGIAYARAGMENGQGALDALLRARRADPKSDLYSLATLRAEEPATPAPAREKPVAAKQGGCWIATAVYGSGSPEVALLQAYRDTVLLQTQWGRGFVAAYYLTSPAAARVLNRFHSLRYITRRWLLGPVIGLVSQRMSRQAEDHSHTGERRFAPW